MRDVFPEISPAYVRLAAVKADDRRFGPFAMNQEIGDAGGDNSFAVDLNATAIILICSSSVSDWD